MFLVARLMKHVDIETIYGGARVMLKDDDGMTGACPVFETREEAETYARGAAVLEIEMPEEINQ